MNKLTAQLNANNTIDVRQEETTANNPCYVVDKKLIDVLINYTNAVDEQGIRSRITSIANDVPNLNDAFAEIKEYIYMVETIDDIRTKTVLHDERTTAHTV